MPLACGPQVQGELSFPMDRTSQNLEHDGMLWDPHKLSATPRTSGTFQAAFQDTSSSMDPGRAASPMPKQPFDFSLHQQNTEMLAQYVAAPYSADVAGPEDTHAPARTTMPVHPGGLLQSSSILGYAIPHGLVRQNDPVQQLQQLQQLQDDFEGPAERIRTSAYRAGSGEGPPGPSTDRAPIVRSSLQGSSGQKKKVPMQCQVEGCDKNLSHEKDYYRRYRICEEHLKLSSLLKDGEAQRFCQQCGRFHPLEDFDADKRSCRARLQLHNNRRRKRDEAPATRPGEASASKEGEVAGAEESSPADSIDADAAIVLKGHRSSRKRRSPRRSSSDGSKQADGTARSDTSEDPAQGSEEPHLEAAGASARPPNAVAYQHGLDLTVRVRQRVVSMPCAVERSSSMQALRSKLSLPNQGIYRHLSSPPRQLPEGQARAQQEPILVGGTQPWRVQSLPATPGYQLNWQSVQGNLQPQLPPQIHQLEPSTISAYLTALNQQTNMMLEVQNFDQQPQHVSTEASSSRQQAPLADILAHNPQPVMRSFARQYAMQPAGVMPARPSPDNLEPNIAQAEALLRAAPAQPVQPGPPVGARQDPTALQAPPLLTVRELEDCQQLPALTMADIAQDGQDNASAAPAHDCDFQLPMQQDGEGQDGPLSSSKQP